MENTTLLMQLFILANAIVFGIVVTLAVQYGRRHFGKKPPEPAVAEIVQDTTKFDSSIKQRIMKDAELNFRNVLDKSVSSLENDLAGTAAILHSQLEKFGHDAESEEASSYQKTLAELHDQTKSILGNAQQAIAAHQVSLTEKLTERQAELEQELTANINSLQEELVARRAELQSELNERQAELEANLAKHHAELRTGFNQRQEKIEAELVRHQSELEDALKERETSLAKLQTQLDSELNARRNDLETKLQEEMAAKRTFIARQLETKLSDAVTSFLLEALQHNIDLGAQAPYLTALLEEHKSELVDGVSRND